MKCRNEWKYWKMFVLIDYYTVGNVHIFYRWIPVNNLTTAYSDLLFKGYTSGKNKAALLPKVKQFIWKKNVDR